MARWNTAPSRERRAASSMTSKPSAGWPVEISISPSSSS
jgi:hypothetical protein